MALGVGGLSTLYSVSPEDMAPMGARTPEPGRSPRGAAAHASPQVRLRQMGALGQDSEAEVEAVGEEEPGFGDGSVPSSHTGPVLAGLVKRRSPGFLSHPTGPRAATPLGQGPFLGLL